MNSVLVLACAQALTATGLTVLVLLGGIVAAELAPRESLATVPISMAVVAVAFTTAPAALLMRRIGRKAGFILGASIGAGAALFTALAIARGSFMMLCAGSALFGASTAFTQQYRFAAAESVAPAQVSRAVSWILLGSLAAALIGPPLALLARRWLPAAEYSGSFVAVAGLYVLGIGVLSRLRLAVPAAQAAQGRARNAAELLSEPTFRVAVLAGVVAFGVMSFVMTAAPISMHVHHDHSVESTTWVIQSHVVAMFLPSLFTGRLVAHFGERAMMLLGAVLLAGCAGVSLVGQQVVHYWLGLVLLGLGWNLLFVSGTTLLAKGYGGVDRHRAQAINEFIVFGVQSCVSLLAGVAVSRLGWEMLNLATLPLLALMLMVTWRLRR
ncbi:MAG TPA: MFS transporter [Steroidobacteraceae bacterium]|nr:MFS transporter [Steroidobacteraceae bacterium]